MISLRGIVTELEVFEAEMTFEGRVGGVETGTLGAREPLEGLIGCPTFCFLDFLLLPFFRFKHLVKKFEH